MSNAAIYSLVNEARSRAESAAWEQFASPKDRAEFCASWLAILCGQIERVSGAILLLGTEEQNGFSAAAVWPDPSRNMQYLGPAAERTLKERQGIAAGPDGSVPVSGEPAYIGYPIEVSGALHGAVVLHLAPSAEADLQRAMRLLHWASAWLVDRFRQQALAQRDAKIGRLSLAADLVATAVQERHSGASMLAIVNELAARMGCERVSVGFERSGSIEVKAISHTATFDRKTNLVGLIGDAMDEVLDLDIVVVHPPLDENSISGSAHVELAAQSKHPFICSVPLVDEGHAIGALTLERAAGEPFDEDTVQVCRTIGLMLGPILQLKLNERGPWRRSRDAVGNGARALFGAGHPGLKLLALSTLCLLVFLSLATGPYRVSAKTFIEGAVQRAAVAPFEGFIAESAVRAGNTVKKGQLLARIDDRNLKLEQLKWASEAEQAQRKLRQVSAAQDRAGMAVISAQIDQAKAQLGLVEDRIARSRLFAPFDGIVVSGDLSQLLGSPVEQGKVLFEIAPLDAYRVVLNVDERDIAAVQVGQKGELALSGIPYRRLPFTVKLVTPIAASQDGHNFFRVEAEIDQPTNQLRPGMEGIGKVMAGERKLIWIWSHNLVDWLRLALWKWLP